MIVHSDHRPAILFSNRHIQTIYTNHLLSTVYTPFACERIVTTDDDFFDVDWLYQTHRTTEPVEPPLIIIQHGLEGSSRSPYVMRLAHTFHAHGYDVVAVNFRGCSGEPNKQRYSYHAGFYYDLQHLLSREVSQGRTDVTLIGVSLGAAALLNMVSQVPDHWWQRMAAISPPLDLGWGLECIERGFSRVYNYHFTQLLIQSYITKFQTRDDAPIEVDKVKAKIKKGGLRAFDDQITAIVSGYQNGEDYYTQNRPLDRIAEIAANGTKQSDKIAFFLADDDPMVHNDAITALRGLCEEHYTYYAYPKGGHVGFMSGLVPKWTTQQWLITDVKDWVLNHSQAANEAILAADVYS